MPSKHSVQKRRRPQLRDKKREDNRRADLIEQHGFLVDFPCDFCASNFLLCKMSDQFKKCSSCTRNGGYCENRLLSSGEWEKQRSAEVDASDKLSRSVKNVEEARAKVERFRVYLAGAEKGLSMALADVSRSVENYRSVKEHGRQLLCHDADILRASEDSDSLLQSLNWESLLVDGEIDPTSLSHL